MAERIRFRGKVSQVMKHGKMFARSLYRLKGKRREVWRIVLDGNFNAAAKSVVGKIEKILNRDNTQQWIYLIHARGTHFYKIGIARCVDSRMKALQSASPFELSLLTKIPGNAELELKLHRQLDQYRARGEWFELRSLTKTLSLFERHYVSQKHKTRDAVVPYGVPSQSGDATIKL